MTVVSIILMVTLIIGSTLLLVGFVFGVVVWWLRRQRLQMARQWEHEGRILLRGPAHANVSGLESKGMTQIRGNGFIALTDQDLRVNRAVLATEWRIVHHDIKQVSLEAAFLGKWKGMKVMVITFETEGRLDRLGLYVRDSQTWVEAISQAADLEDG